MILERHHFGHHHGMRSVLLLADRECVPCRVTRLPEKIQCSTISSDSEEDCITLEALSEGNFKSYVQSHSTPSKDSSYQSCWEMSVNWRISGLMTAWKTKWVYLKVAWLTPLPHSEDLVRDTALDRASSSSLGNRSSSVDEEQPPAMFKL